MGHLEASRSAGTRDIVAKGMTYGAWTPVRNPRRRELPIFLPEALTERGSKSALSGKIRNASGSTLSRAGQFPGRWSMAPRARGVTGVLREALQ